MYLYSVYKENYSTCFPKNYFFATHTIKVGKFSTFFHFSRFFKVFCNFLKNGGLYFDKTCCVGNCDKQLYDGAGFPF